MVVGRRPAPVARPARDMLAARSVPSVEFRHSRWDTVPRAGSGGIGMPDDAVGRLRAGDLQALDELYDRYSGIAFSLAVRPLGPQAAEEAVQDAFLRVWRNIKGFDPERGSFQ